LETTLDDFVIKHDFFTAFSGDESKGIRRRVKGR
jgi:hypothetical protein